MSRIITTLMLALLLALIPAACGQPRPPVQILVAAPPVAYRTLGMVSGQGENRDSALHAVSIQADRIEADAVIIVGERRAGQTLIVTAKAIRYLAPPPGQ